MKRSIILGLALFGIWLLWSGMYLPLLITCGAISTTVAVLIAYRMKIVDNEAVPIHLGWRPFFSYAPWLMKEIVAANFDVAKRIIDPKLPIHPCMLIVRANQKTDLGRVILANSITLTPGTVSVGIAEDGITVHSLSFQGDADEMSGNMDRRVSALEG